MLIQVMEFAGVTALLLNGNLDATAEADLLSLSRRLLAEKNLLILDLSGIEQIASSGIAALAAVHDIAEAKGCRAVFCGLRPFVQEFVNIAVGDLELEMMPDLEMAVELLSVAGDANA